MKTILITGASGGIGFAVARKFAKQNNNLILVCNKNKNVLIQEKSKFKNANLDIFECDLTQTEQIENMVKTIIKKYGTIDCLINCAGVSHFQQIQDTKNDDFEYVIDSNLKSTIMLTSAVSKNMISNKFGRIVNISSIWGNVGASMESLYSASKGAINAFTLSLAKELGPSNITVNAICPGLIDTKMNNNLSKETIEDIIENTPMQRIGKPEDVATLAEFLCEKNAGFITGQIITIDGGFTL